MGTVENIKRPSRPVALRRQIKRLREMRKLSQTDFAELIGVPPTVVQAWESGRVGCIHDDNKRRIQKALNLSDQQIFEIFYLRRRSQVDPVIVLPADVRDALKRIDEGGGDVGAFWDAVRSMLSVNAPASGKGSRAA